jgi:hypothetical protein
MITVCEARGSGQARTLDAPTWVRNPHPSRAMQHAVPKRSPRPKPSGGITASCRSVYQPQRASTDDSHCQNDGRETFLSSAVSKEVYVFSHVHVPAGVGHRIRRSASAKSGCARARKRGPRAGSPEQNRRKVYSKYAHIPSVRRESETRILRSAATDGVHPFASTCPSCPQRDSICLLSPIFPR